MTTAYFMNMAGAPLTDEKRGEIPHPYAELMTHITTKTMQVGSILGAGIIAPAVCLTKGNRDCQSLRQTAFKYGKNGLAVGLIAGPLLAAASFARINNEGVFQRAYKIRFNRKQMFVDRMSFVGAIAGAGAAHFLADEAAMGAVFGFAGGCVLAGIANFVL